MLGGVEVPHPVGLAGHSDADVVAHAVADAVLGAGRLGDIGALFPDDDPKYAGADSLALLAEVAARAHAAGFSIGNVDIVVLCEAPRLASYRESMQERLAAALGVSRESVSVKASTTEGMGFEGRGEGIAALAVCLLEQG